MSVSRLADARVQNKAQLADEWLWLQNVSVFNYAYELLMVNEFAGLGFVFDPDVDPPITVNITGDTWLDQFDL